MTDPPLAWRGSEDPDPSAAMSDRLPMKQFTAFGLKKVIVTRLELAGLTLIGVLVAVYLGKEGALRSYLIWRTGMIRIGLVSSELMRRVSRFPLGIGSSILS